ncbi:Molybdenum cofactor biosynthesis protein MoaB [Asaia bogorensis]|uniref:Molybdenum cofactor biosynthesis protein B n=2 Tax=Acetobacteraceae TaxID=433 RepID=A0A060QEW4_9PROT|nr:Molybdenum cofactor biosynthesis protein MoaB [Asaia bogorensis]
MNNLGYLSSPQSEKVFPMSQTDEQAVFIPCRIAVLTISDSRDLATDRSGAILAENVQAAGHELAERDIVPDELDQIVSRLRAWIARDDVDVVITTGGTGITGRDVTPEAFAQVVEKDIPGFGELFRMLSYAKIGTSTIQSRALGGLANGTFLFALPGSTGAVRDGWNDILVHQLDSRHKPCNFVELMPRLREA